MGPSSSWSARSGRSNPFVQQGQAARWIALEEKSAPLVGGRLGQRDLPQPRVLMDLVGALGFAGQSTSHRTNICNLIYGTYICLASICPRRRVSDPLDRAQDPCPGPRGAPGWNQQPCCVT